MASETHGSILLSTADSVSRMLMKKLDSQTGFKPSEWTDNINLLGALPIRTASGTIAHFEDGADDVPMKSVVANITPVQDLHGYSKPWAAGAGSNKWDEQSEEGYIYISGNTLYYGTNASTFRSKNFIPVVGGQDYYIVCSGYSSWRLFGVDANKENPSQLAAGLDSKSITIPSGIAFVKFYVEKGGKDYANDIAVNYPSTVTTYSPYANVCPISGTDELTLKHDNENMLVMSTFDFTIQGERFYTTNEGNVIVNGSNTSGISSVAQDWKDNLTFTLPKGTFYFKATNLSNSTITIRRKSDNYTFAQTYGTAVTFTLDEETELFIGIYIPENKSFDNVECNFMISVDNITYDVPNRETYTFDLGQEIIGGTADVVGGVGEVTRVVITYDGTENWHVEGTNNFYVDSGRGSGVYYGEDKLLCSHFKSTYSSLGYNNNVYISASGNLNLQCDDITHTVDGIKTWCTTQYANGTPLQICYELKTPTDFTFTGQPINSYLGTNNLYVDSGEVLDVEYRADIDLLIAELEG